MKARIKRIERQLGIIGDPEHGQGERNFVGSETHGFFETTFAYDDQHTDLLRVIWSQMPHAGRRHTAGQIQQLQRAGVRVRVLGL